MADVSLLWRSVFLAVLVLSFFGGLSCMAMDNHPEKRIVGGPCQYKAYPGRAAILSVRKQEGPAQAGAPSPAAYEVKFSFTPHEAIQEDWVRVEGKDHLLQMTNSSLPTAGFLKKYGIETGKSFECYVKVITRGACTPVLFDFPTIDLSDYSERE